MTADIELERVREAYPQVPQPSDERIASLRAGLLALIDNSPGELPPVRPPRWRRGRPPSIHWVLGVVAAIAAILVIVNLNQTGPRSAGAAEARAILRGAAAALALPPGAVLHYADSNVETFRIGHPMRWRDQLWGETSFPYDEHIIFSPAGQPTQEWAVVDGDILQLYDARRNTIYTNPPPAYTVRSAPQAGRYVLTPTHAGKTRPITISGAQLRALSDGQDILLWVSSTRVSVAPYASVAHAPFDPRKGALALLHSGRATVLDNVHFAGRPAVEISGPGPIRFIH
jgi:hypothetical protein